MELEQPSVRHRPKVELEYSDGRLKPGGEASGLLAGLRQLELGHPQAGQPEAEESQAAPGMEASPLKAAKEAVVRKQLSAVLRIRYRYLSQFIGKDCCFTSTSP